MRNLILAAAAAVASLIATIPAAAVVIDFSDQQVGIVNGSLSYPNAQFVSSTGLLYVGAAGGDDAICAFSGGDCAGTLTVTFAGPVYNLSFRTDGDDSATSSLFVSGMADTGAFNFTGGGFDGHVHSYTGFDLSGFSGITSITLTTNDIAGLGFDSFSFDTLNTPGDGTGVGAIPEPASWALMVAGLGLVGVTMRRRGHRVVTA